MEPSAGLDLGRYAFELDQIRDNRYAGGTTETAGRLHRAASRVTEYSFADAELTRRECLLDSQVSMWLGSAGNDRVGE
jgi:hypothetical protein